METTALCVDNHPGFLDMYLCVLPEVPLVKAVMLAGEVNSAMRLYEEHRNRIGIIITDYRMPGLSGMDFLRMLQAQYSQLPPRILITGDPTSKLYHDVRCLGGAGLLKKPLSLDDLLTAVRELIENPAYSLTLDCLAREWGYLANEVSVVAAV